MTAILNFLGGIGLALALIAFLGGVAYRLYKTPRRGRAGFCPRALLREYFRPSWQDGWPVRIIINWLIAFLAFLALLTVFFLMGHVESLRALLGFAPPALPPFPADFMSVLVSAGLAFLFLRVITVPELRDGSGWVDYGVLILLALPFLSGMGARFDWGGRDGWLFIHLLSGICLLALAPWLPWERLGRVLR